MAHDNQRPGPAIEEILKGREGIDVEIVCGLVEHQNVWFLHQKSHELESATLPARDISDERPPAGPTKAKPLAELSCSEFRAVAEFDPQADLFKRFEHAQLARYLHCGLGKMGKAHGLAASNLALIGIQRTGQQMKKGCLAGSIHTDEGDAVTRAQAPGDLAKKSAITECDADIDRVEDVLAKTRGRKAKEFGPITNLGLVGDQRVCGLDSKAWLCGSSWWPSPKPRKFFPEEILAPILRDRLPPRALGSREHVGSVATFVLVDRAVGDLPCARADRVEKPAIVGHDNQGSPTGGEVAGQPVDAFDVEMVRWLVEQEEFWSVDEGSSKANPSTFATAQRCDWGIEPVGEARERDSPEKAVEHFAKLRIAGPLVVGASTDEFVSNGATIVEVVALTDEFERQPRCSDRGPNVWSFDPGDESEKRRLAVAVSSDDANPLALGDSE